MDTSNWTAIAAAILFVIYISDTMFVRRFRAKRSAKRVIRIVRFIMLHPDKNKALAKIVKTHEELIEELRFLFELVHPELLSTAYIYICVLIMRNPLIESKGELFTVAKDMSKTCHQLLMCIMVQCQSNGRACDNTVVLYKEHMKEFHEHFATWMQEGGCFNI